MKRKFLPRRTLAGVLLFGLLTSSAGAATFTVSNLLDNEEEGSLRAAIEAAEATAGADTIIFSVSGTIVLASRLPDISNGDGLTIDGTAQDIIISGNNAVQVLFVDIGAQLALEHLTVANGRAFDGGGIFNSGTLTVADSTLSSNHCTGLAGGGIHNMNTGILAVTDSTFSGNSCIHGAGGGISNGGNLEVSDSTFMGNSAALGGGIHNSHFLFVTDSTFSGNSSSTSGGGVGNTGFLTVISTTFSGNSAFLHGGGLANSNSGIGVLNMANTILANSPSGGDCYSDGTLNAAGVNLVMDGSCSVQGALFGDPLLGPLADNGGPTQTMALLPGSPAIDAITDRTCPPPGTDQRGVSRPQGPYCDIGAFEVAYVGCVTTGDLRSGGSNDTVRITNQGTAEMPYTVQFVNAQGIVQGRPIAKSLAPNQSAGNTIGSLLQQAGIRNFNPANLLQIRTEPKIGVTESPLQSVLTPTNGTPPVMMVYTCAPETPPK